MLENNLKTTGFFIGVLTFIAYIKQYLFYSNYGIDISNYIDITEVFTPFIDDLSMIIMYLLALVLISVIPLIKRKMNNNNEKVKEPKVEIEEDNTQIIFKSINKKLILIHILFFALFLGSILSEYALNDRPLVYLGIRFIAFILLFIFAYIAIFTNIFDYGLETKPDLTFVIFIISFISITNFAMLPSEISEKDYEYKRINYSFYLPNDLTIETDSTHTYLGRTKRNFFMYDIKAKQAYIFNTSDIIQERIKSK